MDAKSFAAVPSAIMANSLPTAAVLLMAASLDYIIGDPWGWPHPVRVMGWVISQYTQFVLQQWNRKPEQATSKGWKDTTPSTEQEASTNIPEENYVHIQWQRRCVGILLAVGLILGSGLAGWLIVQGANWIHPWLAVAIESILLASCLAGRSLRDAAADVLQPLAAGQFIQARSQLSQYVGRDTEKLDEPEILRAILETVTENATDGVTAPLFYGIIGAFLPGIGSVPLALAYKAASTLDSMVGYRVEPYTDLGWFSAKLEDYLTWLPCRLTVITLALLSGKPQQSLASVPPRCHQDPSP
jgi:adenosylcobinamide-phosphate synthase